MLIWNKSINIKNRLLKAKDINNVFNNLKKQDYYIDTKQEDTNYITKIQSIKDNVHIEIKYAKRNDESNYKQYIFYILY